MVTPLHTFVVCNLEPVRQGRWTIHLSLKMLYDLAFCCRVTGYQPGLQKTVIDRVVNDPFDTTGVPHG
jgi:hypothetical protein